ncbi:MAG: aminotransferase class III-fold pyridoxal phosphate-dependent enzyme [Actinomycetota bacterium]|nr:aminotransferase class III-fold pyridoxal phosphate-dependent enzyme [Actinomycetota bacterium]
MALQEQSVAEQLIEARERYVARAGNPKLVVGGAHGAVIEDLNGREFLDFVGGIGCQNLGHGPEKVVAAVHAQVDRFLHQMSMVVSYEGYVDVCRLLAGRIAEEQQSLDVVGHYNRPDIFELRVDASARVPVTWKRSPTQPSAELELGILADA